MPKIKRIGVDVDIPVVRTDLLWKQYLKQLTGVPLIGSPLSYNLTEYYKEELKRIGLDGFDYWRRDNLYNNLQPVEGCVEALTELHNSGVEIVFISKIKGNHTKSKYYFLKKYFPFMTGYVATGEKYLVDVDAMVDDRVDNLLPFKEDVYLFQWESDYIQTIPEEYEGVEWEKFIKPVNSWNQVKDIILNINQRTDLEDLCIKERI